MAKYRAYVLGSNGQFESSRSVRLRHGRECARMGKADGWPATGGALEWETTGRTPVQTVCMVATTLGYGLALRSALRSLSRLENRSRWLSLRVQLGPWPEIRGLQFWLCLV